MGQYEKFDASEITASLDDDADPREALALIEDRIKEYREAGWPIPDGLKRIHRSMMTEAMAQSQGR